jgi:hypothetical protein
MTTFRQILKRPEPIIATGFLFLLGTIWASPRLTLEQTVFGLTLGVFQVCNGLANWLEMRNHRFAPMLSRVTFLWMIMNMIVGIVVVVQLFQ